MGRFIANKVLKKCVNLAHTRKSVGALSRADRPDVANHFHRPSLVLGGREFFLSIFHHFFGAMG